MALHLLIAAGCAALGEAATAPDLSQTDPGTQQAIEGDVDDLPEAIDSVFRSLHWARVRLNDDGGGVRAEAATPDGRPFHLTVETDADEPQRLNVHARVGRFGAPAIEQQFLDALERDLRDRED